MTAATGAGAARAPLRVSLLLGVLGVVYGDIGTSPLYAFKTSLEHFESRGFDPFEVLGILSLIFWSLVLIVTVKYVLLVMRADNRGEGGILALMALAQRLAGGPRARAALALVGIVGACLFFGDGVITPAISVLSAVEGLEIAAPPLKEFVLPISVAVIAVLFAVQYRGTGSVGRVFGPVMALWFAVIGVLGLIEIAHHPHVLLALSPSYAVRPAGARPLAGVHRRSARSCWRSPGRRRCMPTWGISARQPIRLHLADLRPALPRAELLRPGRAGTATTRPRSRTRSSCSARTGCACRWWCWPPRPPSSPARR